MTAKEDEVSDTDYLEAAELFKKQMKLQKQREVQRRYRKRKRQEEEEREANIAKLETENQELYRKVIEKWKQHSKELHTEDNIPTLAA